MGTTLDQYHKFDDSSLVHISNQHHTGVSQHEVINNSSKWKHTVSGMRNVEDRSRLIIALWGDNRSTTLC